MTSPAPPQPTSPVPRSFFAACVVALLVGMLLRVTTDAVTATATDGDPVSLTRLLRPSTPSVRSVEVYEGLGVWVDAFDFEPAYRSEASPPVVTPDTIDEFAALGVETIYLQAARRDSRSPGVLLDETLLGSILVRAHARDIEVVGWYLPKFDDIEADLARLDAIAAFSALGHRFDGVAVDIEFIEGVPDTDERSDRLIELSRRFREAHPGDAVGAIVPPPVQLEVVNTSYWPRFPWAAIDPYYDVWLPMVYWTTRSVDSGYRDAFTYTDESTRRLRNNVGRDDIAVHPIGGIGSQTTAADLEAFARAVEGIGGIGASIYDWASLPPSLRAQLPDIVADGQ